MKAFIAYYSKSGNTEKAAKAIDDILSEKGFEVKTERIKPLSEEGMVSGSMKALLRFEVPIMNQDLDISEYDLIIIGSPMWAGSPAPAVNSYILDVTGLKDKKTALFVTSATGYGRLAAGSMERRIVKKGAKVKGTCYLTRQDLTSNTAIKSIVKNFIKTIL